MISFSEQVAKITDLVLPPNLRAAIFATALGLSSGCSCNNQQPAQQTSASGLPIIINPKTGVRDITAEAKRDAIVETTGSPELPARPKPEVLSKAKNADFWRKNFTVVAGNSSIEDAQIICIGRISFASPAKQLSKKELDAEAARLAVQLKALESIADQDGKPLIVLVDEKEANQSIPHDDEHRILFGFLKIKDFLGWDKTSIVDEDRKALNDDREMKQRALQLLDERTVGEHKVAEAEALLGQMQANLTKVFVNVVRRNDSMRETAIRNANENRVVVLAMPINFEIDAKFDTSWKDRRYVILQQKDN